MTLYDIRKGYHKKICKQLLRIRKNKTKGDYPNNADGDSKISVKIAWGITNLITNKPLYGDISGQEAGHIFEQLTKEYIEETFELLSHLRQVIGNILLIPKFQNSINTETSQVWIFLLKQIKN